MLKSVVSLSVLLLGSHAHAHDAAPAVPVEQQFAQIRSWEGRWDVAGNDALTIVFETAARGNTIVERWEAGARLHSMTVYHLDGDSIIATHYCPQGNQPRLKATIGRPSTISFSYLDATGLDAGESHAHSLAFTQNPDGSLDRSEVYMEKDGLGDPSRLTLKRSPKPSES